jgi:hypothetical protein
MTMIHSLNFGWLVGARPWPARLCLCLGACPCFIALGCHITHNLKYDKNRATQGYAPTLDDHPGGPRPRPYENEIARIPRFLVNMDLMS